MWRKWIPYSLLARMQNGVALRITEWWFFKKLIEFNNSTSGYVLRILKSGSQKHTHVHRSIIHNSSHVEAT